MVGENGLPVTPEWMAQARPAIDRLEARDVSPAPKITSNQDHRLILPLLYEGDQN